MSARPIRSCNRGDDHAAHDYAVGVTNSWDAHCPGVGWVAPETPAVVGGASPTSSAAVSRDDRIALARVIARHENAIQGDLDGRDDPVAQDFDLVDALIAVGWGPVSGVVRPTREEAITVMARADGCEYGPKRQEEIYGPLFDALLSADHMWTEQRTTANDREALNVAQAWCPDCNGTGIEGVGPGGLTYDCPNLDIHHALDAMTHGVAVSPVPVVDREALAQALFAVDVTGFENHALTWDQVKDKASWYADADRLLALGLFVDRAVVFEEGKEFALEHIARDAETIRAGQREKDAQTAELHDHAGQHARVRVIAAAIRAGGTP